MTSQQSDKGKALTDAEKLFHRAMVNIYEVAKRGCDNHLLFRMVLDHGGLEAAKQLLAKSEPSEGFGTLLLCGRLDLQSRHLSSSLSFRHCLRRKKSKLPDLVYRSSDTNLPHDRQKTVARVKFGDVVRQVKDRVDADYSGLNRYIAGEHMDTDDSVSGVGVKSLATILARRSKCGSGQDRSLRLIDEPTFAKWL